jgi:hypothetical protein
VIAGTAVKEPNVMSERGSIVFAPKVLVTFFVFVKDTLPGAIVLGVERRGSKDHFRFVPSFGRDPVKFSQCTRRKFRASGGLHPVSAKDDILSVGSESAGDFVG